MTRPTTIAVFTKNDTNPAYAAARLAADLAAAEAGARTVHYVPKKPDDVDQQKALVAEALKLRSDAVVFVPVDDVKLVEDVAKFGAAGIPVVVCINRMAGEFVTFVGSDDVEVGYIAAKALFEGLGGKGGIVTIDGPPVAPTSRDRILGVQRALAEFPGVELLGSAVGMNQRREGRLAMAELLARHPRLDGVWASNDVMAFGVLEALDEARRTAKVVGVNGLGEAIDNVATGRMLATVDFSAFKICRFGTMAVLRHLRGERVPPSITVPTMLIDKSNCAAWKLPIEQRPCPMWEELVG
jgi:ribose transport system substrate-binding protein